MNSDEFANKIKAKYPDYAEMDNQELTRKMLAKYPDYADQVDTSSFNKTNTPVQPQANTPTESQPEPNAWDQIVSGLGKGTNAIRKYTSIIPAAVGGTAAALGTMAGQRESSSPYLEQLKQAGQEGWQAANEDYSKGLSGEGVAGVVADPVALASLFYAPEYGIAKTGLYNAAVGGLSEASRQKAQEPEAGLDYKKVAVNAGLSGLLGVGLKTAGSKLAKYADNRAKVEGLNSLIKDFNEYTQKNMLSKVANINENIADNMSNIPEEFRSVVSPKIRVDAIKEEMKKALDLPINSKIDDMDAINWFDDLSAKAQQAKMPEQVIESTGKKITKAVGGGLAGAIGGHYVGGPLGSVILGGVGLLHTPIASAIDKTITSIPTSVYRGIGEKALQALPGINLATEALTSKLFNISDQITGPKKKKQ